MIKAGIYVHIPFCKVKCLYCDFYSLAERENSIDKFINAITKEIKISSVDVSNWNIDTIFIGGGTPSILKGQQLEKIISALSQKYDLTRLAEFTLEVNPGEATIEDLKLYESLGINRLSIGVQSFQIQLLKFLTRTHERKDIFKTYNNARSVGFENINVDLIYSIPGQTLNLLEKDLNEVAILHPEHISAYNLTLEKNTELFKMVKKNIVAMPSESVNAGFFERTVKFFKSKNYKLYEISNFSKSDFQCKHNLHYWNIDPYLGFGPSAHSFDLKYRWHNTKNLDSYIKNIDQKKPVRANIELLSEVNKLNEVIGFGLRMSSGFDIKVIPIKYRKEFKNKLTSAKKKFESCLVEKGHNIKLSEEGTLYADEIIVNLLF